MDNLSEKIISREWIREKGYIKVEKLIVGLPDGSEAFREVVRHPGACAVVVIDDDMNTRLVKQYRTAFEKIIYEIPAGKKDPGEDPLTTAKRELLEETGITADKWLKLTSSLSSPGFCNEVIDLFAAWNIHEGDSRLDEGEFLNVEKLPFVEVKAMVKDGRIEDSKTISAVMLTDAAINDGRITL